MKVWLIWVQSDDATWLEAARDARTSKNSLGWHAEVERVRKLASDNGYEMRIQEVDVPGVFRLFLPRPAVPATDLGEAAS